MENCKQIQSIEQNCSNIVLIDQFLDHTSTPMVALEHDVSKWILIVCNISVINLCLLQFIALANRTENVRKMIVEKNRVQLPYNFYTNMH